MKNKIRLKIFIIAILSLFNIIYCINANAIDTQEMTINILENMYRLNKEEAMTILFVAESEKASNLCNFKLTNNFYFVKKNIINNQKYNLPYEFILQIPNHNYLDVNKYCTDWYNIAGSRSQNKAFFQ